MNFSPTEQIKACSSIDELKAIWSDNVESWKYRRDFQAITGAKDMAKERLSWPQTMANAMLRYNYLVDAIETAETRIEAETIFAEGEQIEKDLKNLTKRIVDEKWPIDKDGLRFLGIYGKWRNDNKLMKMEA